MTGAARFKTKHLVSVHVPFDPRSRMWASGVNNVLTFVNDPQRAYRYSPHALYLILRAVRRKKSADQVITVI